ncbi:hypothetical protein ABMC89_06545 [Sulfitobacter sp. HNIBRBA3233]|uniref:hypothetical protein n=1 Tax=Sulfitobacter marinivivus TaxID=3158558 RepID=UPI0032DE766A
MPNAIAYLMLAIWPAVCLVLFRNLRVERAIIWSILGGYLLLPPLAEFNLPLVPALDKVSIPNISVLAILLFATAHRVRLVPESWLARILVLLLVLCAVPTVLTNREPILFEVLRDADPILFLVDALPGQSVRDIGSVLIAQTLTVVPFLIARQFLSSETGLRELLVALVAGALFYSVPSFFEIMVSPQTNILVYGFFQHSFEQTMRAGGFRPIVFLPHGLWLAIFVCTALIASAALTRLAPAIDRWKLVLVTVFMLVFLLLCKSAASIAYGLVLLPVVLFFPRRWMIYLATAMAIVAVTYPMLRNFGVIPTDEIVAEVQQLNPARAESLEYRFNNEAQLLERAAEKPAFGWSGWGRSLVRDSETGEIMTIPDGRWIIVFGTFGWLGYLAEFGLLALPLLLLTWRMLRDRKAAVSPYIGAVSLVLGVTMTDMLLNATLTPFIWLVAGAILGHVERLSPRPVRTRKYAFSADPVIGAPRKLSQRTLL